MRSLRRAAALLLLPLLWVLAAGSGALALLLDLLLLPAAAARRRGSAPPGRGPARRDASIVIPSWNGREYLEALLPSLEEALRAAPGDHETIVVDNGSTDGTCEMLAMRFPWVRTVRLGRNEGFIRGIAAGAAAAHRDILVVLNNDMRVEPDFLARLLAPFGPGDLFATTARIEMEGEAVETGRTRAVFRRGALHFYQVPWPGTEPVPALWAGGGSSAFHRQRFEALGGFEALYDPCYVEDVSLSWRAWALGWRVLHVPEAVVHHVHRGSTLAALGRRGVERLDRRNRHLFFWRAVHDPRMVLSWMLWWPWNLLKQARATGLDLEAGAFLAALRRLPAALAGRARLRLARRVADGEILRRACCVAAHRAPSGPPPESTGPLRVLSLGLAPPLREPPPGTTVTDVTVQLPAEEPPPEDFFGLLPDRFRRAAGSPMLKDRLRDLLREEEYELVHFRDPFVLTAALPSMDGAPSTVEMGPLPPAAPALERIREARHHLLVLRRARRVLCAGTREVEEVLRLSRHLRPSLVALDDGRALAALWRAVAREGWR